MKKKTRMKMMSITLTGALALGGFDTILPNTSPIFAPTKVEASTFAKKTLITTKTSNLYSSTSSKKKVLATLKSSVKVTATSKTGSFYKVTYGSKTGYIYAVNLKTYVTPKPTTTTPAGKKIEKTYFLTTDLSPIYKTASSKSEILRRLPFSQKISSDYQVGDYYKVTYGNTTGYVHKGTLTRYVAPVADSKPTTVMMNTDKGEAHIKGVFEEKIELSGGDVFLSKIYGNYGPVLSMSFDTANKAKGTTGIGIGVHYKNVLNTTEKAQFKENLVKACETVFGGNSKYATELANKALSALDDEKNSIVLVDNRTFNLSYDSGYISILPL